MFPNTSYICPCTIPWSIFSHFVTTYFIRRQPTHYDNNRTFTFHNFVFLLNCFVWAQSCGGFTRTLSQEFLLKFVDCLYFGDDDARAWFDFNHKSMFFRRCCTVHYLSLNGKDGNWHTDCSSHCHGNEDDYRVVETGHIQARRHVHRERERCTVTNMQGNNVVLCVKKALVGLLLFMLLYIRPHMMM